MGGGETTRLPNHEAGGTLPKAAMCQLDDWPAVTFTYMSETTSTPISTLILG